MTVRLTTKTLLLLVLATSLIACQQATAQNATTAPQSLHRLGHGSTLEDQLKTLTQRLNLDATQQGMVKIILQRRQVELLDAFKNDSLSAVDRFEAVKAVHERANDRISHILNPDQAKKFDEMLPHVQRQNPAKPE